MTASPILWRVRCDQWNCSAFIDVERGNAHQARSILERSGSGWLYAPAADAASPIGRQSFDWCPVHRETRRRR